MFNQTINDNLNYLFDPTLLMWRDYLYCHLKVKQIEPLLQSIMYQK